MSPEDKDKPDRTEQAPTEPDTGGLSLIEDGPIMDRAGTGPEIPDVEEPDTSGLSLADDDNPLGQLPEDLDSIPDDDIGQPADTGHATGLGQVLSSEKEIVIRTGATQDPGLRGRDENPAYGEAPPTETEPPEDDAPVVNSPEGTPPDETSQPLVSLQVDEAIELVGDAEFDAYETVDEVRREDFIVKDDEDVEDELTAAEEDIEPDIADESGNPVLRLIGKPENAIRRIYGKSRLRKALANRFEWYRIHLEDQRMERILERTYGGAARRFSIRDFFRRNILASLLILAGLLVGARMLIGIYFPEWLPAERPAATVRPSAAPKTGNVAKTAKQTARVNYINKAKIESSLRHCLVLPGARKTFEKRFAETGYEFSNDETTLAYEELQSFVSTYESLDIAGRVEDAVERIALMATVITPSLKDIGQRVRDYHAGVSALRRKASKMAEELEKLGRARQDTYTINRKIKLRTELNRLNDELARAPTENDFKRTEDLIDRLDKGLNGSMPIEHIEIENPDEQVPAWFDTLLEKDENSMRQVLNDEVLPPIIGHARALDANKAELSRYHLRETGAALEVLYLAASRVMYAPENLLATYVKDLHGVEDRIRKLLGSDKAGWLSFEPCLKQAHGMFAD